MNLSNRIYSRKVLYRLVYVYNFCMSVLNKNIYIDFADKIENIVNHWLDNIDPESFETFDFSKLLEKKIKIKNLSSSSLQEYIEQFNPKNEEQFNNYVSYVANEFVNNKQWATLEYNYIVNSMYLLLENYLTIIDDISKHLDTFKFFELNSVDQSILILWYLENKVEKTHKSILIKECIFLSSTFWSENSVKFVTAILNKVLD